MKGSWHIFSSTTCNAPSSITYGFSRVSSSKKDGDGVRSTPGDGEDGELDESSCWRAGLVCSESTAFAGAVVLALFEALLFRFLRFRRALAGPGIVNRCNGCGCGRGETLCRP